MMIAYYESKNALKKEIGKPLKYTETTLFGQEYRSNGTFNVCNRPSVTGARKEFFATITIKNDILVAVD